MEHPDFAEIPATMDNLLGMAFGRVDEFIGNFHGYLYAYWKNQNIDFGILENERLRNPVEAFTYTIELFKA
jgi:hypothetical protein